MNEAKDVLNMVIQSPWFQAFYEPYAFNFSPSWDFVENDTGMINHKFTRSKRTESFPWVPERLEVSNVTIVRKAPTRTFLEGDTIGQMYPHETLVLKLPRKGKQ